MIEIGIISIIVLAVGYWVTLWLMGRHDDVLHGDFVHSEPGAETAALPDEPFPDRPPFPAKPTFPVKPVPATNPCCLRSLRPRPRTSRLPPSRLRWSRLLPRKRCPSGRYLRQRLRQFPSDWIRCNRCWHPSSMT